MASSNQEFSERLNRQTRPSELNPMGMSLRQDNYGAIAASDQERAIAEVQAAMAVAKRFPRDERLACDKILNACTRQTLAETALYAYARGGNDITGPSIRMAEMIAQSWGNISFGIRELSQEPGRSTVEAFAHDLESNTRQTRIFQVSHIRRTKARGVVQLEDPRDIYETVANQGARRLRACILGIIPGDVVDAAVRQIETTLKTNVKLTPERIQNMLDVFDGLGVTKQMIEQRIQRRLDAITPAMFIQLGKIANSIKEGMSGPSDWFSTTQNAPEMFREKPSEDAQNGSQSQNTSEPIPEEGEVEENQSETNLNVDAPSIEQDMLFDLALHIWDSAMTGMGAVAEKRRIQRLRALLGFDANANFDPSVEWMANHKSAEALQNISALLPGMVDYQFPKNVTTDEEIQQHFNKFAALLRKQKEAA